jgi:hypothetical protein
VGLRRTGCKPLAGFAHPRWPGYTPCAGHTLNAAVHRYGVRRFIRTAPAPTPPATEREKSWADGRALSHTHTPGGGGGGGAGSSTPHRRFAVRVAGAFGGGLHVWRVRLVVLCAGHLVLVRLVSVGPRHEELLDHLLRRPRKPRFLLSLSALLSAASSETAWEVTSPPSTLSVFIAVRAWTRTYEACVGKRCAHLRRAGEG